MMKRYFYILLLCACAMFGFVANVAAQIKSDDIVTISYKVTDRNGNVTSNYLYANGTSINDKTTYDESCLWKITISGTNYSFQNVKTPTYNLYTSRSRNTYNLTLGNTASSFVFNGSNVNNVAQGTLSYTYDNNSTRYIRFNNNSFQMSSTSTTLTIEKWTRVEVKGGLKGEFEKGDVEFGWAVSEDSAATQGITREFTIKTTSDSTYYDCLNTTTKETVGLSANPTTGTPNISHINFAFDKKGQHSCASYTDATIKNRTLLTVSAKKDNSNTNTWIVTITPVGSSPMELQSEDSWIDFTDNLVAAFREEGDANETTYRSYIPVKRRSYHREILPNFVITADKGNYIFSKDGLNDDGETDKATFTFTCKHQHGEVIKHMYGFKTENIYTPNDIHTYATEENIIATNEFASFSAKNTYDESAATWLTVSELNNGQITLTATENTTGSMRNARLTGVFNYVNPNDASDKHTAYIEIPISQRFKDGETVLVPNKGHSGDALIKNPHSGEYQQQVHTVNKTIYYLAGQDIELRLQENTFRKYRRWYDYETGCNPVYNANETDRTTWTSAPKTGNTNYIDINNTYGNSYGLYSTNNKGDLATNNPILKGWTDGKAHIMACDVSAHTDYTIGDDTIIEPTLSYRQIFHLKPASEMANKLCSLSQAGKYLETYKYTVPTNQVLLLSSEFRYLQSKANHVTECCYFYNNGTPQRITTGCQWYKNGTLINTPAYGTKDYLQVAAVTTAETTATYQLRLPKSVSGLDYELLIAEFQVSYVDNATHGPVNTKTTGNEIISYDNIASHYQILAFNDFSYGAAAPGTSSANQHSGKRLPWSDATYGFYYPNLSDCDRQNSGQGDIPYYGEYALINYMQGGGNNGWGKGEQHGGASNGYALYVDGTEEPGLVASISTDAEICSGQIMYCSMWLMNPRSGSNSDAVNPIFRCNIQGRRLNSNGTYGDWEDVGIYYVGEVGQTNHLGTGWQQVVFPVKSDISYDETRVQIYNFGTGGMGNDFLLDDICLYASPLPLATYHQTTGCTSYADSKTTNTVVVVRIDYSQLKELNENQLADSVFYQIVDVTTVDSVIVKLKDANGNPTYHHDGTSKNEEYGSIAIPKEVKDDLKKENVDVFVTELTTNNTATSGKCFVQDHITEKWFLYLVQIIPNGDEGDRDKYLDRDRQYILRVAYNAKELHKAACVFTSPLLAKQDTYLELRNEKVGTMRVTSCLDNLCANNHHFLDVKVSNAISASAGGAMQTYEALVHADWLRGFEEDDVCCEGTTLSEEEQNAANTAFFNHYGYTRSEIKHAIVSMRQKDGKNYTVSNADDLQVDGDFGEKERAMIRDLCNKGLLKLYQQSMMFYLGSAASARYWVYPVAEDAIVIVNGTPVPLQDCDEPLWVKVTSEESEYGVNLSPKDYEDLTEHQRLDIPTIRVIEGTENVTIPVKELIESTRINTELSTDKESIKFNVHNPKNQVLEYIDLSNNQIEIQDAPTSFEVGKEYLMRMAFYDENGYAFIGGDTTQCRVGYVYFYLMFAPKENTWTGAKSAIWGDDRNWSGGCAPLPETDVIIPVMPEDKPYPIVTKEDKYPLDVNYKSYTCNDIYFAPGAMIHNQHLLQYNKAFVDMKIEAANWNSMAPPLKGMYTGDMYVPHNGMYDGTTDEKNAEYNNVENHPDYPFVVNSFQGTRTSKAPYVFWQSLYNKRATIYHENGNQSHPALTTTAIFAQTNSLGQPLPPGTGYQVLGFGPQRNESDDIIVRLPKPDTYYSYYYSNGTVSDQRAYVEHSSKLAFEPDANGDMYITLTNDLSSNQFMFGNPAMTNIDMKKFLEDPYNAQLAKKYYTMSESSWKAENWFTMEHPGSGELAPMRSVLLELVSGEAKSITIKLSKTHLVGYTEPVPAGVVARKYIVEEESGETQLMTIYATSEGGQARCILASNAYAQDIYNNEEDALFISSGVEEGVNSATATSPVNMYTVSEQVPMMVDVRENIDTVPVSMLVHDSYRTEKVRFSFYLSLNWEKECYFCDAVTGARYRILDGLWLEMDMPLNHATRYFITGPDRTTNSGVVTNTTNPNVAPLQVWAYSEQAGEMTVCSNDIIQSVTVYDITGHIIARQKLDLLYNQVSLPVGQGVHIAEVTLRDNSKHYTRAIVP